MRSRRRNEGGIPQMRRVIIESPYAGDVETHIRYARRAVRHSLSVGEAPYASHLLYTQLDVLNDNAPFERELGINAGHAWKDVADMTVVYIDYGISDGVRKGIEAAERAGRPIIYRQIGRNP